MVSRKWTVKEVGIKRRYGEMTARKKLLQKLKLRAALALSVATEEEETNEEKERRSFVSRTLAVPICQNRVGRTLYDSTIREGGQSPDHACVYRQKLLDMVYVGAGVFRMLLVISAVLCVACARNFNFQQAWSQIFQIRARPLAR